jgi:EAL domain-containing protein (putative c-di-GMP-specific phosphodiesterase class I)
VFQPQANLSDESVGGVEALARWNHKDRGALLPEAFIPMAEHTGLIDSLTDLVLERALEQVRVWAAAGTALTVAVNVSARSLRHVTFTERLRALLDGSGVAPESLVLEVTERALMADPERTLHNLDRLCALGVGLSVDDLGTGQSSLAYLRRLPVHEVKVDRSFVTRMATDPNQAAIVGTIVQLGHRLGKRVVAEGVEDEHAWQVLRRLGCDLAQGYWICRPGSAAQLEGWLRGKRGTTDVRGARPAPSD